MASITNLVSLFMSHFSAMLEVSYLGCFNDDLGDPAISSDLTIHDILMTNEMCISYCRSLTDYNFRYAATISSVALPLGPYCRCAADGVEYDRHGPADGQCTFPCGGSEGVLNDTFCGGEYKFSVWDLNPL